MTKKAAKIREQSAEERQALLEETTAEIFKLKNALSNKEKNVTSASVSELRRQVARIKTIQTEKGEKQIP